MNTWNPQISIVHHRDAPKDPWRVELSHGVIIAAGRTNDVDQFCAQLHRAVATARELNTGGDHG